MKFTFLLFGCCLFFTSFSQKWRKVSQAELNMKYQLPADWEVDGFGGGFNQWDEDGSSVCKCSGTINFGPERKLGMVVYPTTPKTDQKRRESVWDCHFVPVTNTSNYQSKKIKFIKSVSKWEQLPGGNENTEMMDDEVWKFTFTGANYGFVIYFWGDKDVVAQNEKTIYKVLDSFTSVKE